MSTSDLLAQRPGQLGSLLVRAGLITQPQLEESLREQTRTRQRLGEILIERKLIQEQDVLQALAGQLQLQAYDPSRHRVEPAVLDLIPIEIARRYSALALERQGDRLIVAMSDPTDILALDRLRALSGCEIHILLAPASTISQGIERHYARIRGTRNVEEAMAEAVVELRDASASEEALDADEAERSAQDAPIIKLVEEIIGQALNERATDIHVEPQESMLIVRYRVDGLLTTAITPPRSVMTGLTTRIKILANLDIAEQRKPQDGRFTVRSGGREVDVRVSSIPTIHGEKMVLRLLEKGGFHLSLRDLGFSESDYETFIKSIHEPYGMVLLSGPTGSGKTTTLYAGLLELRSESVNITTVEDPVEYQIARVNQVQVNAKKNVTFATALRSFLRQDPDVMMVGEIRDSETAEMAIRAALTGHMVFSTIHANDACSTVTRLLSMGPDPFQAGSALTLVAAQRLVRRNCPHCQTEYRPGDKVMSAIGELAAVCERRGGTPLFLKGAGCVECRGRGYLGRVAIVELLRLDAELRWLVTQNAAPHKLRETAQSLGMKTLREAGVEKALSGETTLEEVLRVCLSD